MKSDKLKIKYEPEADVLSWEINNKPIDYAKEAGNFVVHFSADNVPVMVEILNARNFLLQGERAIHFRKNNITSRAKVSA